MLSTMQDRPLLVSGIFRHGAAVHGRSRIRTFDGERFRDATFAEVAERTERLARALQQRLGVTGDDRVATFMWNAQEHVEVYFAAPGIGAVMHTLNLRLPPEQLVHIANHAEDKVVIAHTTVAPMLAAVADQLKTVEHVVLVDDGAPVTDEVRAALAAHLGEVHDYEQLLASVDGGPFDWPDLDERSAAAMCFTSGTTGDPKGVVYSHRSTWLHSFMVNNSGPITLSERDRILLIVPQFHVNAWGYPYAAWMHGTDMIMPSRFLQGPPVAAMIEQAGVTLAAGVPTIWQGLLAHVEANPGVDLSSVRFLLSGGSALPRVLIERFGELGVTILQGWGMTETSPVCAVSAPPADADDPLDPMWRLKAGRVVPGVDLRIVTADGAVAPWDGTTEGEIEVRGPWITGAYYRVDDPEKFHDGWLRTGDVGTIDDYGFLTITDRVKDVIKSGGEWISSVALENEIMGHPDVAEASVVGVSDERWGERPLAVVVRKPGSTVTGAELRAWLEPRVARFWLPERWTFVDEIPKTSVGKFDKKVLRSEEAAGRLEVESAG
ncbi:MAG TPA: long-chain fatty acid--CoA ligase [Acidimicrobiales bacterium]|nr:long-chain fatty acid--CoA ligase [Acidimicrobiales bacterium]